MRPAFIEDLLTIRGLYGGERARALHEVYTPPQRVDARRRKSVSSSASPSVSVVHHALAMAEHNEKGTDF